MSSNTDKDQIEVAEERVKTTTKSIAKLAKEHEFARWRVAEKCGWANSFLGQCKPGEPPSAYPDNLEALDEDVVKAIDKYLESKRKIKSAKRLLRKESADLARLLRKRRT